MKQFAFLTAMMVAGALGSLFHPFWGVLLYYALAVLRPQYLWKWALPDEIRWSLLAAAVVVVSLAVNLPRVMQKGRMNLVAGRIMCHSFFLLLSVLAAFDVQTAQTWGLEYAKIILIAMIATFVIDSLWQIAAVALTAFLALGYIAWEMNYLYIFDGRLDIFHNGYGGLDNNGAGLMLAMGIPLAYVFGTAARKRWQRAAAWVVGLLMLHAMLMSYSRGAMIAATLGVVWILIQHRPRRHAILIAAAICLVVPFFAGNEIRQRLFSTAEYERDDSANSRLNSWSAAWEIASDYPITGQGIRNSSRFTFKYGADKQGRTIHSQYLQVAADSGIPAMVLYVGVLAFSIAFMSRARRRCREFLDSRPPRDELEGIDREIALAHTLALGCQASLVVFAFGAVFLSLEVFELPWIFIVLGGVFPACVERRIEGHEDAAEEEEKKTEPGRHGPARRARTTRGDREVRGNRDARERPASVLRFPPPIPRGVLHP